MYLTMVRRWLSTLYLTVWRKGLMRSGMVTGLVLACALVGLTAAYLQHLRGNFHRLKAKISDERQDIAVPRPGGQDAIVLTRSRQIGDSTPQFLSATILPGRGMNVLQITAYIPGAGEVKLLASPSVEGAAEAMTGMGADGSGQASLTMGSAFEVPWADGIWGTISSGDGRVVTSWRGHTMALPAIGSGDAAEGVSGGLMLSEGADSADTTALPDGGEAEANFDAADFGAHWPSKTHVTVTVLLSRRSLELTVVAQNAGDVAEPVGIGWRPRFTILGGNRGQLKLHIPSEMRVGNDRAHGLPTGVLMPVAGTSYDFSMPGGERLGTMDLDDCFVALHQNLLDSGPVAELSDPAENYGVRLTALSSTIEAMRVLAPASADFVSIEPQFNVPDPFGREWAKETDTGMVVLQPGQSTRWKIRMELFSLSDSASGI